METEFRFVLLDFGTPMDNTIINTILNSIENIIALELAFPRFTEELYFGISVLNSDFTILYSESYIRKNYDLFSNSIKSLLKMPTTNTKVTVRKYTNFLAESIKKIIYISQEKLKTENLCNGTKTVKIKTALVTKKVASIIIDLLANVINKLFENFSNETLKQVYKVVQILREPEEKTCGVSEINPLIKWMTCTDSIYDLNFFFKDWFLRCKQQLQIQLSTNSEFKLQCKVDDLIINPISRIFEGKYDLFNEIRFKASKKNSFPGSFYNLDVINRISVKNLSPTFVYGVPRIIRPIRKGFSWTETQVNRKLFKELCWEMSQSEEALVAKSIQNEVTTFHFLTSDGCMLLMHDITTEELYLPKRMKLVKPFSSDENAASIIKSVFQKIEFLETYSPVNFSSGLYKSLKNHLVVAGRNKSFFGSFNPDVKLFGKKFGKKKIPASNSNDSNDENCSQPRKRSKLNMKKEFERIHPALLPAEVVTKYRKAPLQSFNTPKLSDDNLT